MNKQDVLTKEYINTWVDSNINEICIRITERFFEWSKKVVKDKINTLFGENQRIVDVKTHYKLSDYVTVEEFLNEPTGEFISLGWGKSCQNTHHKDMNRYTSQISQKMTNELLFEDGLQKDLATKSLEAMLNKGLYEKKTEPLFIFLAQHKGLEPSNNGFFCAQSPF